MRYKTIKEEIFGKYCTDCMNFLLHTDLSRKDCVYVNYTQLCARCKRMHHIVIGVSPIGRIKLLGARK